jgi:hypothetical protein
MWVMTSVKTPGYCQPSLRDIPHGELRIVHVPLKIRAWDWH